jgi:nucleotide-binding universal stress UspA family protein
MQATRIRRILCPINFGDGSQRTVEGAAMLAEMYDAELRLLHVVPSGDSDRDAETLLAALFALTRTLPGRTRVSAALAHGEPSSEILQHARLMTADVIVIGATHRSLPAMVRGTIAADVAAHAPCPVLYVRPHLLPSLSDTARGFSEIVCCADSVSGSPERGDYARALARHSHARVTFLNVLPTDDDTRELTPEAAEDTDRNRDVVHVSLTGSPESEIVDLAKRIGADLIVMGTPDEGSPHRRLGSITAHVMVHAPCAVLIIPRTSNALHMTSNDVRAGCLQNEMTIAD